MIRANVFASFPIFSNGIRIELPFSTDSSTIIFILLNPEYMSCNYLWLSDLHVDRLAPSAINSLIGRILAANSDGIWITGDIGEPPTNWNFLKALAAQCRVPIYFVLGNHDYYGQSIEISRVHANDISTLYSHVHYLTLQTPILLKNHVLLIGMDAWANTGEVGLTQLTWDSEAIIDLKANNRTLLKSIMNDLAEQDANLLLAKCRQGITQNITEVRVLTHIPPFIPPTDLALPKPLQQNRSVFYSCALNRAITILNDEYPHIYFYFHSGHVHRLLTYKIDGTQGKVIAAYTPDQPFVWEYV